MRTYQRGVLLGLTLAEIFILLLFVVLISLKNSSEQPKGNNPSDSPTDIGVSPPEDSGSRPDTFPIPDTPEPIILNGSPLPPPPALGINATKSIDDIATTSDTSDDSPLDQSPDALNADGKSEAKPGHNWPPIITITEAQGYSFPTGSAAISSNFEDLLRTNIAVALQKNVSDYNANVIEVFGHTDEQPKSGYSNLDSFLINAINGRIPILKLQSADNVGLGMARAVAVVQVLSSCPELAGVTILPYSAGQAINSLGSLSEGMKGDDPARRRIEIRLRGNAGD